MSSFAHPPGSLWVDLPTRSVAREPDAERAALALTEAATRLNDRAEAVPDETWKEAARHYDETALSALVMSIGVINRCNRLNVTTRRASGDWTVRCAEQL